ncbi:MAG: sugar ABC transporter permease, partial [Clostridiales bacterium]|nr:sugar ABC transporter permease [Clostridiales bacterium]
MGASRIYRRWFTAPAVAIYTLLFIVPVLLSFYYSLTNWNAVKMTHETAKFVGLANFEKIFSNADLTAVIIRTIWFALATSAAKNVLGFLLALAFNQGLKTKSALRAVFFLPSMLSPLIIGLMFGSLFMTKGSVNQLLEAIGFGYLARPWLTTKSTALGAAMIVDIWRSMGYDMVIYLAGLQLIDPGLYEAASIDGASWGQKLKSITLPLMVPSIVINLLLNVSSGLKVFDIIMVLTNGGPV